MTSTLVWGSISEWIAITEIFVLGANKKPGLFYLETVDLNCALFLNTHWSQMPRNLGLT